MVCDRAGSRPDLPDSPTADFPRAHRPSLETHRAPGLFVGGTSAIGQIPDAPAGAWVAVTPEAEPFMIAATVENGAPPLMSTDTVPLSQLAG